jgi:tRNA wybutosine-synthesizing protein 1
MSGFLNSLIYNFSNILSVGPEQPEEGGCACGPKEGGCCKSEPVKTEPTACCQGSGECSETKEQQVEASCGQTDEPCGCKQNEPVTIESVKVIFSTLTGTAKDLATHLETKIKSTSGVTVNNIEILDITEYDNDNLLAETSVCIFVLSTYNVEGPLDW